MPSLATVEGQEERVAALVEGLTTYLGSWMGFRDIMLSEVSWSQKDKSCVIPFR